MVHRPITRWIMMSHRWVTYLVIVHNCVKIMSSYRIIVAFDIFYPHAQIFARANQSLPSPFKFKFQKFKLRQVWNFKKKNQPDPGSCSMFRTQLVLYRLCSNQTGRFWNSQYSRAGKPSWDSSRNHVNFETFKFSTKSALYELACSFIY